MASADPLAATDRDIIIHSSPVHDDARPLFEALAVEYEQRYAGLIDPAEAEAELNRFPPERFVAPDGVFLLLRRAGQTIGGGAYVRYDERTAELKRIWAHGDYRRQGLARRIVRELEAEAIKVGYRRIVLSTGFRQPEAVKLYLSLGYRPLFEVDSNWEEIFTLSFEKDLDVPGANA